MRINYLRTCDLLLSKAKPSSLRTIYRMLTGDVSAAENTNQTKVDERVRIALDLGDPEIVVDLREYTDSSGRPSKYDEFWKIAAQFLEGKAADVVTAVDECRHDIIMHLATAISVNDLLRQIEHDCLPGTLIPSAQWLRLQFWPKNPTRLSSLQFTGRLPLKFMVQTCQLRAYHPDAHYTSALFRYKKEFAMKFHKITNFIFLDDKHRCKVGEPRFPIAAVERRKRVVVSENTTFEVADHDYTKTGIIPSVVMICNIPESINSDFYAGKVYIGLKDLIFQSSSPLRYATELSDILLREDLYDNPILCLYTDGGPDHCCTFTSIQLSYICLFLALDLDYFVAVRTPLQHSWKNLVKRIMSILNLGLQSVGLMRTKMDEKSEKLMSKAGTMNEIHKIAEENPDLKDNLIESLQTPICLISDVFSHQFLKKEPFKTFDAASEIEMERFWNTILLVDDNITREDRTAADIKKRPCFQEFFDHCCTARHYFFLIKKCGESSCMICCLPRCLPEDFEQLHCLPDPIPGDDLHYKSFEELYSMRTTENHRPSLMNSKNSKNFKTKMIKTKHTMPFCLSAAHAKNVHVIVKCTKCEKLRLLFSLKKLSKKDITLLQKFLDTIFYTCGMSFYGTCDLTTTIPPNHIAVSDDSEDVGSDNEADDQENTTQEDEAEESEPKSSEDDSDENIEESDDNAEEESISELFSRVFVNDSLSCASKIEKPYYSAGIYPNVCIECGSLKVSKLAKGEYSYCSDCGGNSSSSNSKNKGSKNKRKCVRT